MATAYNGSRTSKIAAAQTWNVLPEDVTTPPTWPIFVIDLKLVCFANLILKLFLHLTFCIYPHMYSFEVALLLRPLQEFWLIDWLIESHLREQVVSYDNWATTVLPERWCYFAVCKTWNCRLHHYNVYKLRPTEYRPAAADCRCAQQFRNTSTIDTNFFYWFNSINIA